MGNQGSNNGGNSNREKIIQSVIQFGYTRNQVTTAMQCVSNPNDINQILTWLEQRKKAQQQQQQSYNSSENNSSYYGSQASKNNQNNSSNAVVPYNSQPQKNDDEKEEMDEDDMLMLLGGLISLAVVEEHGFVIATEAHRIALIKALSMVQCSGATALNDAVLTGVILLLELKAVMLKLGIIKHKFVHIVLTDGADTSSEASQSDMQELFKKLGDDVGDLCKTFFIGVNLGYQEKRQLSEIARFAGDSAELFNCEDVELESVFKRIQVNLGIRRNIVAVEHNNQLVIGAKDQLIAQVQENKFLVLFTLDISGSMAGARWDKVVRAVAGFCLGMKDHDILGCILFNDKARLITK
jgi:hypothetical protein